jgi:hypothetical protein
VWPHGARPRPSTFQRACAFVRLALAEISTLPFHLHPASCHLPWDISNDLFVSGGWRRQPRFVDAVNAARLHVERGKRFAGLAVIGAELPGVLRTAPRLVASG